MKILIRKPNKSTPTFGLFIEPTKDFDGGKLDGKSFVNIELTKKQLEKLQIELTSFLVGGRIKSQMKRKK